MQNAEQRRFTRKQPLQARSRDTVEAIIEATIQILLSRRTSRLTTKAIAARAGVSVGSVYQYFPNKEAIVLCLIGRKAEEVTRAVENVARQQQGEPLESTLRKLAKVYLSAKFSEPQLTANLHALLSRDGGAHLLRHHRKRMLNAVETVLRRAPNVVCHNTRNSSRIIWATLSGAGHSILEAGATQLGISGLHAEVQQMLVAYADRTLVRTPHRT